MPAKKALPCPLTYPIADSIDGAERDLVLHHPGLEAAPAASRRRRRGRERGGPAIESRDAVEPRGERLGIRLQPLCGRGLGRELALEDAGHHLALAAQRELEIPDEVADVRALLEITGADVGVDRRAAVVGPEARVAAREVAHVEARVHRVRLPAEEHDRALRGDGALDLGQHALLARLDELEVAEVELVLLDQGQHQPVAVVAGLDAVDLVLEFRRVALDVREVVKPGLIEIRRHGERVLRAVEVCAHDLDRTLGLVGPQVRGHRGHPVAEEYVDVAVLQRGVSHRHGQHGDLGLVAEQANEVARESRRRRDVGPADVREAHGAAGLGIGRGAREPGAAGTGSTATQPGRCAPRLTCPTG